MALGTANKKHRSNLVSSILTSAKRTEGEPPILSSPLMSDVEVQRRSDRLVFYGLTAERSSDAVDL
ncbi:hypothetical protein J3Q64DRAFT_1827089 [Phycomyces blakesleeanus]|uniref:Uncharacterized protein n=1 Tax=Phycomyces blakesleeanus TaxID=4837 RepID=A0ABR3BC64_PHYBL